MKNACMSKVNFIMSVEVEVLYNIYIKTLQEVEPDYPHTPLTINELLDPTIKINSNLLPVFYGYLMEHFKELVIQEYTDTDREGLVGIVLNEEWLEPNGVDVPLLDVFESDIDRVPLKVSYDIDS